MVNPGHSDVRDEIVAVGYRPPDGTTSSAGGCEPMTVAELRRRAAPDSFATLQRLELHLLLHVSRGSGEHVVDFETVRLTPGTTLWVRPGQVHRWGDMSGYEGRVVLFAPGYLDDGLAAFGTRVVSGPGAAGLGRRLDDLAEVAACPDLPRATQESVVRHLLAAVLVELDARADTATSAALPEPYVRLRADVERRFAVDRDVASYAARLGYSPRTLARATRQAAGLTPKELIDARVVLEARRLLAHSDLSVARIAAQLGFADPANFSKFFRHRTGVAPGSQR